MREKKSSLYPRTCENCDIVFPERYSFYYHIQRRCKGIMKRNAVVESTTPAKKARMDNGSDDTTCSNLLINYSDIVNDFSDPVKNFYINLFPVLKNSLDAKGNDPARLNDIIQNGEGIAENVNEMRVAAKEAINQFEPIKCAIKEGLQALSALNDEDLKEFIRNSRTKDIDLSNKKQFHWAYSDKSILDEIAHCEHMIKAGKLILKGRAMGSEVALLKHIDDNLENLFKKPVAQSGASYTQDFENWN